MRRGVLGLTVILLVGCKAKPPQEAPTPRGIELTAALVSPTSIALKWSGTSPAAAGQILEFATQPEGEYTVLAYFRGSTSFTHPDLMPEARFYYRVRDYFGSASASVEVTTGKAPPEGTAPKILTGPVEGKVSPAGQGAPLRDPQKAAFTAPTGLAATVVSPTEVELTWLDHASDEEGFLLETKTGKDPDYQIVALMPPNTNAFGLTALPPDTRIALRVRPFYYGKPSNVAAQTTGSAPAAAK